MLEQIITQFQAKGWNLYEAKDKENLPQIVAKGPTEHIGYNQQYLVLPKIEKPNEVLSMQYALNRMQVTQKFPLLRGRDVALSLISFLETEVIIKERVDLRFSYDMFNRLLTSLTESYVLSQH